VDTFNPNLNNVNINITGGNIVIFDGVLIYKDKNNIIKLIAIDKLNRKSKKPTGTGMIIILNISNTPITIIKSFENIPNIYLLNN
jgi:hypothetical protein